MGYPEKEQISKDLMALPDHQDKFKYLIKKGKNQPELNQEFKIEKFRIQGCMSKLWLHPQFKEGKIYFSSDSDAAIPKGIAAILTEIYSGLTPDEALEFDSSFLKEVGVAQHLSMNRSNGLVKLYEQIRLYALAFKSLNRG
ncbi:MAG: Fe-S metabolism protein SufE [Planctomycetota bacterium]|nr:MAG: Fe-S metabolism protein SufE [Planctomycetota bacterium]